MDYDGGFIMQKAVDWSLLRPHHIDYFTHSQNNDSTNLQSSERRVELVRTLPSREGGRPKVNIIIISPNYHRIIHKNNPRFNRKKFQFEFENGEVLRLKLFEHLKV